MIEIMLVILILGILLAVATATFLNQQDKAQDTSTKSALTNVAHVANADYIQSTVKRTNLIRNPSFETNCAAGWTSQSASLTWDDAQSIIGTHSCKVTTLGTAAYGEGIQMAGGGPDIIPGKTYTYSIYVKGQAGEQLELYLDWRNAAKTSLGPASTTVFTTNGSWQRLSLTKVATATTGSTDLTPVSADLKVTGRNGQTQGALTFWVDGAMLEQSYDTGSYFDGDHRGTWTGSPNGSASTSTAASTDMFSPQIADQIADNEPEYTITSTGLYPADPDTIDIQYLNPNQVVLRATSSNGTHYNYELNYADKQRKQLRFAGTDETAQTNFVLNPSFEAGTTGWTNGGTGGTYTTFAPSSEWSASGNKSAHLITSVPAGKYVNTTCCSADLPGGLMSARATINVHSITGGSSIHLEFNWLNSSGTYINGISSTPLVAGDTGVHTLTINGAKPGPTAVKWSLTIQTSNQGTAPAGTADFDLDSVLVANSSSVPPYFDGSYPDAVWNDPSQPNNSTSTGYAWDTW